MVAHPVEDNMKAHPMSFGYQRFEIVKCAELGINSHVVPYRVITAQFALSVEFTDRIDWHEPQYVDSQILQTG